MVWAGQRVQIVKPDAEKYGRLQFGTEVVSSEDKTLVGLLGASPGASVSPYIAIEVLDSFEIADKQLGEYHAKLAQMIPSYGRDINSEPGLYASVMKKAREVLLFGPLSGHNASSKAVRSKFAALDRNHDGKLSNAELRKHLTSLVSVSKQRDRDGKAHRYTDTQAHRVERETDTCHLPLYHRASRTPMLRRS